MDGGREGSMRQRSVTSAAEQTGGDSWAPSFTAVIRSSRTAHHMGWHNLFIQSLGLHAGPGGEAMVCVCVCVCRQWEKGASRSPPKKNDGKWKRKWRKQGVLHEINLLKAEHVLTNKEQTWVSGGMRVCIIKHAVLHDLFAWKDNNWSVNWGPERLFSLNYIPFTSDCCPRNPANSANNLTLQHN